MLAHSDPASIPDFDDCCHSRQWRRTAQRRAVYDYLRGNREHPSVDMVWEAVKEGVPDISLDSVYRILDDFSGAGLIRRLEGARVMRYDSDTSRHGHFLCSSCEQMFDFAIDGVEALTAGGRRLGIVESVELTIHGVCADCLARY